MSFELSLGFFLLHGNGDTHWLWIGNLDEGIRNVSRACDCNSIQHASDIDRVRHRAFNSIHLLLGADQFNVRRIALYLPDTVASREGSNYPWLYRHRAH